MFLPNNTWQFQGVPCYDHGVPTAAMQRWGAQVPSNLVTTTQGIKVHLKKESCNRPDVAQRAPRGLGSQIS